MVKNANKIDGKRNLFFVDKRTNKHTPTNIIAKQNYLKLTRIWEVNEMNFCGQAT